MDWVSTSLIHQITRAEQTDSCRLFVRWRRPLNRLFHIAATATTSGPRHRDSGACRQSHHRVLKHSERKRVGDPDPLSLPCLDRAEHARVESHLQSVIQRLCTGVAGAPSISALHSPINPESWSGGAGEICHTSKSYQQPLNTSYYYTQYTCSTPHEPWWKEQSSHCDRNQRRNGKNGRTACALGMIYLISVCFRRMCACVCVLGGGVLQKHSESLGNIWITNLDFWLFRHLIRGLNQHISDNLLSKCWSVQRFVSS